MGVTLERVQNKFACIIGELCGEPKILSQFAVWLDLRLAEYKSKGSISLECSGSVPEPSWLEGLTFKQAACMLKQSGMRNSSNYGSPSGTYCRTPRRNIFGVSSPGTINDGVLVKTEIPTDDFLYYSEIGGVDSRIQNSSSLGSRKRSTTDTHISEDSLRQSDGASLLKYSRRSDAEDIHISESSFLPSASSRLTDNAGDSGRSVTGDTEREMSAIIRDNIEREMMNLPPADNSSTNISQLSHNGSALEFAGSGREGISDSFQSPSWMSPRMFRQSPQTALGEKRIDQTFRNIMSAAGTFERWLSLKATGDLRPMEKIPPVELDQYFADFFMTVKKRSGQDYNSDTLLSLRSNIERYLREKGYPYSITKSEVFNKSQQAFKARRQELFESSQKGLSLAASMFHLSVPLNSHGLLRNPNSGAPQMLPEASVVASNRVSTEDSGSPTPLRMPGETPQRLENPRDPVPSSPQVFDSTSEVSSLDGEPKGSVFPQSSSLRSPEGVSVSATNTDQSQASFQHQTPLMSEGSPRPSTSVDFFSSLQPTSEAVLKTSSE